MNKEEAVELLDDFARYLDERIISPAVAEITLAVTMFNRHEPKRTWEMLGEYLREAAVLVIIFVPLERLMPKSSGDQIPVKWLGVTLMLSIAMLGAGILAERRK